MIKRDFIFKKSVRKKRQLIGRSERAAGVVLALTKILESEIWEREMLQEQLHIIEAQEKEAKHAAFHDPLTGLPNRALFKDRLHDIGDSVLCTISERLKANTRSDDTVCRYGGDEFLFLLMEVKNKESVEKIAQSLFKIIQQPCILKKGDSVIQLIIKSSIGISMYPQDGETVDDLINSADQAMYHSKKSKSGYSFA